jgi:hypothetical protein
MKITRDNQDYKYVQRRYSKLKRRERVHEKYACTDAMPTGNFFVWELRRPQMSV